MRVGRFSREEFLNNLLDVGKACLRADLLECLLDFGRSRHLLVHLCLQEGAPELLGQKVFVHLELVRVFVVIGSLVPDLLLAGVSFDAALKGSLLVVKGFQHGRQSVLPLEMVLVNQSHQLFKSVLGLQTFLLGLSVSVRFFLVDLLFILETLLSLIESDLNGNEVGLHAVDHVLVLPLHHHLVVVGLFDLVELVLCRAQTIRFPHHRVFNRILVSLRLLQFSLHRQNRGQYHKIGNRGSHLRRHLPFCARVPSP